MKILILKIYAILIILLSWMPRLGIISDFQFSLATFIPVVLFIISLFKHGFRIKLNDIYWFFIFLLIVSFSIIINESNILDSILNLRWLILPLFVFLFMMNEIWTDDELKEILRFIFLISIIHIPIGFIKYFILGWDGEWPIGLIGYSYSTPFILIFLCAVISFLYIYRKPTYIIYFLGAILMAIASGKRALVFLIPIFIFVSIIFNNKNIIVAIRSFILFFIFAPIFFVVLVKASPSLNPEKKFWGSFNVSHIVNYSTEYTSSQRKRLFNRSSNRNTTTAYVIEKISENPISIFFGYGGDILSKSGSKKQNNNDAYYIEYGHTGFTWLSFQFGIISAFLWFYFFIRFYFKSRLINRYSNDKFWISYSKSVMLAALILSIVQFSYAPDYKSPTFMTFIYIYLAPILIKLSNTRKQNEKYKIND